MPTPLDPPLIMPITLKAHHAAQQNRQATLPKKAKQVYLNTLAIAVVNNYLNALGITADPSHSDNLVLQTLSDSATLFIPGWGELECRPVLPDQAHCYVPPEVWAERQGYVAVRFNPELTEAELLGYLPKVAQEQVPLERFAPIETLIDVISELPHPLSQWFNDVVQTGWETVETLFNGQQLAFAFRSMPNNTATQIVQRGKWICLEHGHDQIALLIDLAKTPEPDFDISVQVSPQRDRLLPNNLKLFILDEQGESLMQASARESGSLTCEFSGHPGEQFSIKLKMGESSWVEPFLI